MYQFKANGGFGMMHQAAKRRLDESPFLQSNQIKPNDYTNLKIGVSWTEERAEGKVKSPVLNLVAASVIPRESHCAISLTEEQLSPG